MTSVLILSRWNNSFNIALLIDRVRKCGLRPVLVTAGVDGNCEKCDDHILLDWETEDLPTLIARLAARGIDPIAVVNPVESLNAWQVGLAEHYGLPGADAFRTLLASKLRVREHMRAMGLSTIKFSGDPARVDFFPAIVKPSQGGSASFLVRRVDNAGALAAYQRHLAEIGFGEIELIIEEFLPGAEFSVDGPAVGGRYYPVLAGDMPDYDYVKHHNSGLQIHPPQQQQVRDSVHILTGMIDAICADLQLDQIWLHVEARVGPEGRVELIEINPRPGGGMLTTAVRERSGIDQMDALVAMALGQFTLPPDLADPLGDQPLVAIADIEADELGTVTIRTAADDIRALPGVADVHFIDGFQISSLEKENFFIYYALIADTVEQLRACNATVLKTLDYSITPPYPVRQPTPA